MELLVLCTAQKRLGINMAKSQTLTIDNPEVTAESTTRLILQKAI